MYDKAALVRNLLVENDKNPPKKKGKHFWFKGAQIHLAYTSLNTIDQNCRTM